MLSRIQQKMANGKGEPGVLGDEERLLREEQYKTKTLVILGGTWKAVTADLGSTMRLIPLKESCLIQILTRQARLIKAAHQQCALKLLAEHKKKYGRNSG